MTGPFRCRWVRARLPLLAGRELVGFERRRVERHLIGCPDCRRRRGLLSDALDVLHAAGAESPVGPDSPSLWPALALQIRESRRPVSSPDFASLPFSFGGLRLGPALLGLGLGLAALVAIGWGVAAHQPRIDPGVNQIAHNTRPVAPKPSAPAPSPRASATSRAVPIRTVAAPVVESPPPRSIDYDLEHGTPMPTDPPREARETRPTY